MRGPLPASSVSPSAAPSYIDLLRALTGFQLAQRRVAAPFPPARSCAWCSRKSSETCPAVIHPHVHQIVVVTPSSSASVSAALTPSP